MARKALIPSMYHRRLLLLFALSVCAMTGLAAQLTRLTVVQGAEHRAEAESRLILDRWTPTWRGRILDRKGRVLATDQASFNVAVEYQVITGAWAYREAAEAAREANARDWSTLDASQRDALIQEHLPAAEARLEGLWETICAVGEIKREELERRKQEVIRTVQRMAAAVWARRLERENSLVRQREQMKEIADVARPIREQRSPHVLLRGLDDERAFQLREMEDDLPGLSVIDAGERAYPHARMLVSVDRSKMPSPLRAEERLDVEVQGVARHIVGWMRRKAVREDFERRPRIDPETGEVDPGHYQLGDPVGAWGIEKAWEDTLRGLRGRVVQRLDTGEREEAPPTPGRDVTLTIDVALQARIQALLDPSVGLTAVQPWHNNAYVDEGEELNAAAVVLDIDTGDALAMVSWPSFTIEQKDEATEEVFQDPLRAPWVNRPIARPYPPGSIVKPMILVEAVTRGAHALGNRIWCNGHLLPERPDIFRCWVYAPEYGYTTQSQRIGGPLGPTDAVMVSSNIYFYTLGRALGTERILDVYRDFKVGTAYETGLGDSVGGFLGRLDGGGVTMSEATMMGIGQGPVSWTPLHAADCYATLARRGVQVEPRVVAGLQQKRRDLGLDQAAIDAALRGLERVVEDDLGTAHHLTFESGRDPLFNIEGLRVLAKTGTAQASPTFADPGENLADDPENPNVLRRGPHSWTLAIVGPEGGDLQHVVAVIVEHGGSGARCAGPIANQVIKALVEEGYLPSAAGAEGG